MRRDITKALAVKDIQATMRRAAERVRLLQDRIEYGSPGEELMTCKTWAVAVCCSNASRVSVKSRAFSIAMTACAAKFSTSTISLLVNGRTSGRPATI